jgi:hypothetical protein
MLAAWTTVIKQNIYIGILVACAHLGLTNRLTNPSHQTITRFEKKGQKAWSNEAT